MKKIRENKTKQINIFLMLALIVVFSVNTFAFGENMDIYFGLGYNQTSLDEINDLSTEDVDNAMSYHGGIRTNITEKFKIGLDFEAIEAEWSDLDYQAGTMGTLLLMEYELLSGESNYGLASSASVSVYTALGIYNSGIYYDDSYLVDEDTDSAFGYKAGVQYKAKFSETLGLQARVGYRESKVEFDNLDLDFSGVAGNVALVVEF